MLPDQLPPPDPLLDSQRVLEPQRGLAALTWGAGLASDIWGGLVAGFGAVLGNIIDLLNIGDLVQWGKDKALSIWSALKTGFAAVVGGVVDILNLGDVIQWGKDIATAIWDAIVAGFSLISGSLLESVPVVGGVLSSLGDAASGLFSGGGESGTGGTGGEISGASTIYNTYVYFTAGDLSNSADRDSMAAEITRSLQNATLSRGTPRKANL